MASLSRPLDARVLAQKGIGAMGNRIRLGGCVVAALALLGFGNIAGAGSVYVEPDAHPDGTVLNNAYVAVTLSTLGGYFGADNNVYSLFDSLASTGTRVFGNSWDGEDMGDFGGRWGFADFFQPHLKAEFDSPVASVSIDAIGDDPPGKVDYGRLEAFNSSGVLIGTYETGPLATGQVEQMTITRPTADIAYILAAGRNLDPQQLPTYETLHLDNMVYDEWALNIQPQNGIIIPLPSAAWMGMCLLAAGAVWRRLRTVR